MASSSFSLSRFLCSSLFVSLSLILPRTRRESRESNWKKDKARQALLMPRVHPCRYMCCVEFQLCTLQFTGIIASEADVSNGRRLNKHKRRTGFFAAAAAVACHLTGCQSYFSGLGLHNHAGVHIC